MISMKKKQTGSSLIEILIATGVVGLVMTAVAAGLVLSVKNSSISKYKVIATTRAQEAMEVFRRERTLLGWTQFKEVLSDNVEGTYCINTLASGSAQFKSMATGECEEGDLIAGTSFTREALVNASEDEVRVEIVVKWVDSGTERFSNLVQEFKEYE